MSLSLFNLKSRSSLNRVQAFPPKTSHSSSVTSKAIQSISQRAELNRKANERRAILSCFFTAANSRLKNQQPKLHDRAKALLPADLNLPVQRPGLH